MEHLCSIDFYRDDIDGRTIIALDVADESIEGTGETMMAALRDLLDRRLARRCGAE